MYGLILENLVEYIKQTYGEEKWENIRSDIGLEETNFNTHQVYGENLIPKIATKAIEILEVSERHFFYHMGVFFISFLRPYGYDRVLLVLGRHMRDFLNGLDNLHEYLRFSYPKMRAPSFICENETSDGLTLHYRSKRKGFVYYTMGQIKEVARHFYHKEMQIELIKEELLIDMIHTTFQLSFDNRAFNLTSLAMTTEEKHLPINASIVFEIFPFCIVFGRIPVWLDESGFDSPDSSTRFYRFDSVDKLAYSIDSLTYHQLFDSQDHGPITSLAVVKHSIGTALFLYRSDMVIRNAGNSLVALLPDLIGKRLTNWFDLVRPLISFNFQTIMNRTNNVFELISIESVLNKGLLDGENRRKMSFNYETETEDGNLRLKGQMIYMNSWEAMMYLGTPVMPDLNSLIYSGLYINDLSMHDFSRDLMLAGTQQSVELKLALDQEQQKSQKLEESMRRLDEEMKRTDELLYQMIPRQVADRLRGGENAITTCEMFESVSILFSDVVTFTEICSRITPMQVVSMLNAMYSIFDHLSEQNKVYKVETIGDAYMVVSGAPQSEDDHAEKVCNMALDMVDAITNLKDPSTGKHLEIRVGVHSGTVVAGVVGLKMPRYCLFGDSVNIASKMESTSEPMKIHISQPTRDLLPKSYRVTVHDKIHVKETGYIKTYWLETRKPEISYRKRSISSFAMHMSEVPEETPEEEEEPALRYIPNRRRPSLYSPVTFSNVASRAETWSIKNSTAKSNLNSEITRRISRNHEEIFGSELNELTWIYGHNDPLPLPPTTDTHNIKRKEEVGYKSDRPALPGNLPSKRANGSTEELDLIKCPQQRRTSGHCGIHHSTINAQTCDKKSVPSKHVPFNGKSPSDSSLNHCCSGFNYGRKHTFSANACSIT